MGDLIRISPFEELAVLDAKPLAIKYRRLDVEETGRISQRASNHG
jgi:hypothetical protein